MTSNFFVINFDIEWKKKLYGNKTSIDKKGSTWKITFDFAKRDRFPISLSKHLSDKPLQPINCNFYFAVLIANYSFNAYYRPVSARLNRTDFPRGPKTVTPRLHYSQPEVNECWFKVVCCVEPSRSCLNVAFNFN